jgi:hypothetical protein
VAAGQLAHVCYFHEGRWRLASWLLWVISLNVGAAAMEGQCVITYDSRIEQWVLVVY